MLELSAPQWGLAAGFGAAAILAALGLRARTRGRDVWRYDTGAAWLRAAVYFAGAWALAAATGTVATIRANPIVFPGQTASVWWVVATVVCLVVVVVGYWVIWPRGTEAHGRRVVLPDTLVFGLAWGVSEGLLFASIWVTATRVLGGLPAGRVLVAVATIVLISAWNGFGHALYWDVHVSPEHNIVDWNLTKVMFVHNPNLILTTVYVTTFENLAIWVGLQTIALLGSAVTMPFPTFRAPHPPDPTRPTLGPAQPFPPSLTGRTVVVTGAGGGLGELVARRLAAAGARVVVMDRDLIGGARTVADIVSEGGRADLIGVDLGDYDDVRRAATDLLAVADRIDVLINNAGIFRSSRQATAGGHDATLAVNHLGGFLLTQLLRDRLVESGARVVFVSSDAHWQATRPDPADLAAAGIWKGKDQDNSAGFAAYNNAKLWVTACAVELAERWRGTGVTVNVLTPGALVPTGIYADLDGWMGRMIGWLRPILRDPAKAVRNYLYVATSPEVEGVTGWYFKDQRPIAPSLLAQDPELRRQLWVASSEAVGLVASAPHA